MTENIPTSADQMQDILDIAPHIAGFGMSWLRIVLWVLVSAFAMILLYKLWQVLKKYFASRVSRMKPDARAFYELEKLKQRDLIAKQEWSEYYFTLTEILKRYFTDEFKLDLLERTTEEILPLKEKFIGILGDGDWESTKQLLLRSDPIKFANVEASPSQADEDLRLVRELVVAAAKANSVIASEARRST